MLYDLGFIQVVGLNLTISNIGSHSLVVESRIFTPRSPDRNRVGVLCCHRITINSRDSQSRNRSLILLGSIFTRRSVGCASEPPKLACQSSNLWRRILYGTQRTDVVGLILRKIGLMKCVDGCAADGFESGCPNLQLRR